MQCPKCGIKTKVQQTLAGIAKLSDTIRIRKCLKCGCRFRTGERFILELTNGNQVNSK